MEILPSVCGVFFQYIFFKLISIYTVYCVKQIINKCSIKRFSFEVNIGKETQTSSNLIF